MMVNRIFLTIVGAYFVAVCLVSMFATLGINVGGIGSADAVPFLVAIYLGGVGLAGALLGRSIS